MFGVPALCEIGGRGLVPRQHSAISTDAPDEVGAFVVVDAPLVACLFCVISQYLSEDTCADTMEVAPVGAASIIFNATGWVTFADMWRRVIVKRGLQKLFLEHGQCRARICGGTGGLEHTRRRLGF